MAAQTDEGRDGEPMPLDEDHEAPAFASVRLVELKRSMGSSDTAWHPELAGGSLCPQGCGRTLKRHRNTVYCGFCRQRWWSRKPRA